MSYKEKIDEANKLRTKVNRYLKTFDLSIAQYEVMKVLHEAKAPINMTSLAEKIGYPRHALTGIVDSLERKGWAERHRSAVDRRLVYVRPSNRRNFSHVLSVVEHELPKLIGG